MKYDHEAVLNRWKRGQGSTEIADALGMASNEAVRIIVQRARKAGDPRAVARRMPISGPNLRAHIVYPLSCEIGGKLHGEASKRGLGVNELVDRLIRVAVSDDLIGVVLDDEASA